MKKLLLILAITSMMFSCKKDTYEPTQPEPSTPTIQCNCGLILSDDPVDYSIMVRNDCSGNVKKFILYPGDWINAFVGNKICFSNNNTW